MSQSENTVIEKLGCVINDENYYYIGVKGSPFGTDCCVFGLNSDEIRALSKRFPTTGPEMINGDVVNCVFKGPPFTVINALAEIGYRVVCTSGEADPLWTMRREL